MRFIATADWQLGMAANFLDDDARPRFQQARLDAVRRIAALAAERGAEFVVVAGDVFETNQLDRAIVARACEALATFTVPVVLLPGNHDPLDAASLYDAAAFTDRVPPDVHVLRDSEPYEVVPGAQIVGAPWFSKRPLEDLLARACAPLGPTPEGMVRVLLGHGAVSSLDPDRSSLATIDERAVTTTITEGRAHVAILGDRHGTYDVAPGIWYPGTPEVTARREVDPGNVLLVDVAPATGDVEVEKVQTGTWVFMTFEADLMGTDDVAALAQQLADMPNKERTGVWLKVGGSLSTRAKAQLDQVIDEAGDLFARLYFWKRHYDLTIRPEDADFVDLRLGGFAQAALEELITTARSGGEEAPVAQDALTRLHQYAGGAL